MPDKLWNISIRGSLFKWLQSYLVDRRYAVCIHGGCSKFFAVSSGVPQGSSLGPILFAIFVNDLARVLRSRKALLYTDDAKVFRAVNSPLDCTGPQCDLDVFVEWSVLNGLSLNTDKCTVTSSRSLNKTAFNYTINGRPLSRVSSVKNLGVLFDDDCSFTSYIEPIFNKAVRKLGFIKKTTVDFKLASTIIYLYKSLVMPLLTYCSSYLTLPRY